ncbi:MAG: hypothetical protein LBS59_00475 [Puniceicoccales bacterium]|jgi:ribosomal protein S20|nr:hypothetical protein [Puniceicoccales bacterium]
MSLKPPQFPRALSLAEWRKVARKDKIETPVDVEDTFELLEKTFDKIKWNELDATKTRDAEAFLKAFPATLKGAFDLLFEVVDSLANDMDKQKVLKGTAPAKAAKVAAKSFRAALVAFQEEATSAYEALSKETDEDNAGGEDEDDDDKGGSSYNLKKLLKRTKRLGEKGQKFAFVRCTTDTNTNLKYQLFLDKKKLTKSNVGKFFGDEYEITKLLAIGRVTFDDGAKTFVFATKQPPKEKWKKEFTKVFKYQKCKPLGEIALTQLSKDDPDFNDPEDNAFDADDEADDGNSGDTQTDVKGDTQKEKLESALKQVMAQAAKAGITDKLAKSELDTFIRRAQRQLADDQPKELQETLRAILAHIKKHGTTSGDADTAAKGNAQKEKMENALKQVLAQVAKAGITDKLTKSEIATLIRRAQRQITEDKPKEFQETLREILALIKKHKTTSGVEAQKDSENDESDKEADDESDDEADEEGDEEADEDSDEEDDEEGDEEADEEGDEEADDDSDEEDDDDSDEEDDDESDKEADDKSDAQKETMESELKQVLAQVAKAGITDKLAKSEIDTLTRRARRQITEDKPKEFQETLREIIALIKKHGTLSEGAAKFEKEWSNLYSDYFKALDTVSKQVAQLQNELKGHELEEVRRIAQFGFGAITKNLSVPLRARLLEVNGASPGEKRTAFAAQAIDSARKLAAHLESEKMVAVCDDNPFGVKVAIKDTLLPVLARLQETLINA